MEQPLVVGDGSKIVLLLLAGQTVQPLLQKPARRGRNPFGSRIPLAGSSS